MPVLAGEDFLTKPSDQGTILFQDNRHEESSKEQEKGLPQKMGWKASLPLHGPGTRSLSLPLRCPSKERGGQMQEPGWLLQAHG